MEIGAVLDHLHISSPEPRACARFYAAHFVMRHTHVEGAEILQGPARKVVISAGVANRLKYAAWRFPDGAALAAYRRRVPARRGRLRRTPGLAMTRSASHQAMPPKITPPSACPTSTPGAP